MGEEGGDLCLLFAVFRVGDFGWRMGMAEMEQGCYFFGKCAGLKTGHYILGEESG